MKYPTTSKTLIDSVCSGNDDSWTNFYQRYRDIIIAVGRTRNLSSGECDDLVQRVMCAFFKNSSDFVFNPDVAKFRTYFNRIVSNQICKIFRENKRRIDREQKVFGAEDEVIDPLEDKFVQQWCQILLDQALTRLRAQVKANVYLLFELAILQERPTEEVAAKFDISVAAVHTATSRCRQKLKTIYADLQQEFPEFMNK